MNFKLEFHLYGLPLAFPGSDKGLPQTWKPVHALPETQLLQEPIEVHLRHSQKRLPGIPEPVYLLVALCEANDPQEVLERCRQPLQNVVHWLRIQTLGPVTPAGKVMVEPAGGSAEPVAFDVDARGYLFPEFGFLAFPQTQPMFDPAHMAKELDSRVARAFAWFAKGLADDSVVDALVATFVCIEILSTVLTPKSPKEPLICPKCNQPIATCPQCSQDTSMRPLSIGRRVQELLNAAGATPEQAAHLWSVRHLIHGKRGLNKDEMSDLVRPLWDLRSFALHAIKIATKMDPTGPPHIFSSGPVMSGLTLRGQYTSEKETNEG